MASTLNRYGLFVAALFAIGALVGLLGPLFGLSFGNRTSDLLWFGIACVAITRWRRGNIEAGRKGRIAETGARGVATVVSASGGEADRGFPTLSLCLELEVPGIESRRVSHEEEVAIYAAHGIKPGLRLPVVVDPLNPENIVLVW